MFRFKDNLTYPALIHLLLLMMSCSSIDSKENVIINILSGQDEVVDKVIDDSDLYKLQILYTQIDRDSLNRPSFTSYSYRTVEGEYFYPASTVKMPTAIMALEKLNRLKVSGLDKNTTMLTDSAYSGQVKVHEDTTSVNGLPSISHYIKKIFLVSDNDAYNRLYEFIGQSELNEGLLKKGYDNTRITHRLQIFLSKEENQHTNPVRFYKGDAMVYQQSLVNSPIDYTSQEPILLGKGHYKDGEYIEQPMDFSAKNYMSIPDMQLMLKRLLFPEVYLPEERFELTEMDYQFLYKYMSMFPSESNNPEYDSLYYDSYVKFFMFGDSMDPMPGNIRIFNKVGDAYGFLIDNAYVVDFENKVEFLLSAVLQVNANEVYNDGKYEYDEIGFPFLSSLGQIIYDYERNRPKNWVPDLSKFKIDYSR